jgi:hypothetical protein
LPAKRKTIPPQRPRRPGQRPRALAIRELLLQEAARVGLRAQPLMDAAGRCETEAEALVRGLVETEVLTPTPDPAELPSLLSG